MSYGQQLILIGMVMGATLVVVLAGPRWWSREMQMRDLRSRLTSYRKNWKKP